MAKHYRILLINKKILYTDFRITGQRDVLLTVPHPSWYSASDADRQVFFSTAVEDPIKYPNSTCCADIWEASELDGSTRRVGSWKKGPLERWGIIDLIQGSAPPGWLGLRAINLEGFPDDDAVIVKTNSIIPPEIPREFRRPDDRQMLVDASLN